MPVAVVALVGCDRMISDRIVIAPPSATADPATIERLTTFTRESLTSCGAQEPHVTARPGSLTWRNPETLPGLTVDVNASGVKMYQHLYGMVGATEAYQCVKEALAGRLQGAFGAERVTIE